MLLPFAGTALVLRAPMMRPHWGCHGSYRCASRILSHCESIGVVGYVCLRAAWVQSWRVYGVGMQWVLGAGKVAGAGNLLDCGCVGPVKAALTKACGFLDISYSECCHTQGPCTASNLIVC
jgi:hypothetical protein